MVKDKWIHIKNNIKINTRISILILFTISIQKNFSLIVRVVIKSYDFKEIFIKDQLVIWIHTNN